MAVGGSVRFIEPVGFLGMIMLEKNARLIVTDSGGVQKEAFSHQTRCVALRDETEWVELLDHCWNRLVPPTAWEAVYEGILESLEAHPGGRAELYGDGRAAERIAVHLATAAGVRRADSTTPSCHGPFTSAF